MSEEKNFSPQEIVYGNCLNRIIADRKSGSPNYYGEVTSLISQIISNKFLDTKPIHELIQEACEFYIDEMGCEDREVFADDLGIDIDDLNRICPEE